jgi:hypothetical protein
MSIVTVSHLALAPGPQRRRRRSAAGVGFETVIRRTSNSINSSAVEVSTAQRIEKSPTERYRFKFWAAAGGPDGPQIIRNTDAMFAVGINEMVVNAWYAREFPPIPGPPGPPGVLIDAFNLSNAAYFDDDFVTCPTNPALTSDINADGFVPTTTDIEVIAQSLGRGFPFRFWGGDLENQRIQGNALRLQANDAGDIDAFYESFIPRGPGRPERIPDQFTLIDPRELLSLIGGINIQTATGISKAIRLLSQTSDLEAKSAEQVQNAAIIELETAIAALKQTGKK